MAGPAFLFLSSILSLLVLSSACFLIVPSILHQISIWQRFLYMESCCNMEGLHIMCAPPKNGFTTGASMKTPLKLLSSLPYGIGWSEPTIKHYNNNIEA